MTIIVEVTLEQERLISSVLDEFKKLFLNTPEVMQVCETVKNIEKVSHKSYVFETP